MTCPRSPRGSVWNTSQMLLGPKSSFLPFCTLRGTWLDWSSAGPRPLGPPAWLSRDEPGPNPARLPPHEAHCRGPPP